MLKEPLLSGLPTVLSLCVSALWMEILWEEDSGCGMNFNVNTKKQRAVISAGIRTGAGVAPRCNLFKALSLGGLKVGFKRQEYEEVWRRSAWAGASQHQRLLTVHQNTDDSENLMAWTLVAPVGLIIPDLLSVHVRGKKKLCFEFACWHL